MLPAAAAAVAKQVTKPRRGTICESENPHQRRENQPKPSSSRRRKRATTIRSHSPIGWTLPFNCLPNGSLLASQASLARPLIWVFICFPPPCRSPVPFTVLLCLPLLANLSLSLGLLYISVANYPGGAVLRAVNGALRADSSTAPSSVSVYVTDLAAQSGFTRFLQLNGVEYVKTPAFVPEHFAHSQLLILVIEPEEERRVFGKCTTLSKGNNSKNQQQHQQRTCQLAAKSATFECKSSAEGNMTAFDRIDLRQMKVNYRTPLSVYKCRKVAATS